ncbi:MAG: CARDB domain-containing protein, partial [Candidatus Thorarchaeota archaeon]
VLEHDIAVTQLSVPDFIFLEPQNVSAQVSNIGNRTEYNIEVNLTQNGTTISKKTIPLLASEENKSVTFGWTPPGVGQYEICIETTPVVREDILWNNYDCKMVNVTAQVYTKIAVLRSYGTQEQGPKDTWDYLNAHWEDYGPNPILIDYTSLSISPITYQAINDTQADVLVLSGSGYYYREPIGTELTDEEMRAIEKWTNEGHGFVTIGSAFHHNVSNNNGLVGLVGIKDQPYEKKGAQEINIFPECANHSIFRNVSSPFQNAFGFSIAPAGDLEWNIEDLDRGTMCARSPILSAAVVINKGNVMISIAADVMPNEDEKQLLYNSFVWSRMEVNDYDVEVSTIAPKYSEPTFPVNIRSRVTNVGKKDLSLVRVDLKVDGIVVDSRNITNLPHFESVEAYFTWTPPSMGIYQLCSYGEIVGFTDQNPADNEDCMLLNVTDDIPVQVYVVDSWGTDFAHEAPWDFLNAFWDLFGSVRIEINYTHFNRERITYQDLVDSFADVLLISSSRSGNMTNPVGWGYRFSYKELQAIERYTKEGHGLIATGLTFDTELLPEHGQVLGLVFGLKSMNLYCPKHEIHDMSVLRPWENHPLFNNIPDNYSMSNGTTLSPCLVITDWPTMGTDWYFPLNWTANRLDGGEYKAMSYPTDNATVIANDPGAHKAVYITNFAEKNSSWTDMQLLYNAMTWVGYQPGIHDIAISNLTIPQFVKPSPLVDVSATLTNLGTVVEDNFAKGIDIFLTEDGLVVDQTNVPSLDVNESKNVTLTWDPPDSPIPQTYAICMYAWPVMWERNTSNNELCTNVEVIDPGIVIVSILDSWGTDNPMLA